MVYKDPGEMCWLFVLAMLNHDIFRPWRDVLAVCSSNDESRYIKTLERCVGSLF